MTRFQQELSGQLGEFWQRNAEKELDKVRAELKSGEITIDENGVARNCIGRVLMSDMLEKLACVTDKVNTENTKAARDEEVSRELEEYRRNYKGPSEEELYEMRAAFGAGTEVVDIITGRKIKL